MGKNIRIFFRILFVSCLGLLVFFSLSNKNTRVSALSSVLVKKHQPTKTLLDMLDNFGVSHDGTLSSIVAQTQKQWLRKKGLERWQIEDTFKNKKDEMSAWFYQVMAIQEIKPSLMSYDYLLVMGASYPGLCARLKYALELWQRGIRCKKIVFLVGQRSLDSDIESEEVLTGPILGGIQSKEGWCRPLKMPLVEIDLAKMLFDRIELPADMKDVATVFGDTPNRVDENGLISRPTMPDTVKSWLLNNPEPGSCLIVSSQPHCGYYDAAMRLILPACFPFEVVGASCDKNVHCGVVLDALARWLYQELALNNNKTVV